MGRLIVTMTTAAVAAVAVAAWLHPTMKARGPRASAAVTDADAVSPASCDAARSADSSACSAIRKPPGLASAPGMTPPPPQPASASVDDQEPADESVGADPRLARVLLWGRRLQGISRSDSQGLAHLRAEIKEWIRSPENAASLASWMDRAGHEVERLPVRQMFLLTSSVIREAPHPEPLMRSLLTEAITSLKQLGDEEPGSKLSVTAIYALDEYIKRLEAAPAEARGPEAQALLPDVVRCAQKARNLAVVRGAVRLVRVLSPHPSEYWASIRDARAPSELFALSDLLVN